MFVRLYKQYVLPHLDFSSAAWSPWTEGDKEVLEKVQRRMVAMVSGLAAKTYEGRLGELSMFTLAERRHQTDMVQVYKILHCHDRVEASQWFNHTYTADRLTRRAADPLNLVRGRCRLDLRRNFFSQRVTDSWNNIPEALKRARTADAFKRGYRRIRMAALYGT